jgi:hypothetical protein
MPGNRISYFLPFLGPKSLRWGGSSKKPLYTPEERERLLEEYPPDVLLLGEFIKEQTGIKVTISPQ